MEKEARRRLPMSVWAVMVSLPDYIIIAMGL